MHGETVKNIGTCLRVLYLLYDLVSTSQLHNV